MKNRIDIYASTRSPFLAIEADYLNRQYKVINSDAGLNFTDEKARVGRSTVAISCQFCNHLQRVYRWSFAGSGKRCEICGALNTRHGAFLHWDRLSAEDHRVICQTHGITYRPQEGATFIFYSLPNNRFNITISAPRVFSVKGTFKPEPLGVEVYEGAKTVFRACGSPVFIQAAAGPVDKIVVLEVELPFLAPWVNFAAL